jgi:hypothetical protein
MKCVTKEDGYNILREIHEGIYGNHAASRTLVGKAYRAGFWWPTAVTDARISCASAKIVNSSANRLMFQPIASSLYRHPGLLLVRAST